MGTPNRSTRTRTTGIAAHVRTRIDQGGERLWRFEDFQDLPANAVALALTRLARQGKLERVGKGLYYRSKDTPFGKSRPNPSRVRELAKKRHRVFPAGTTAANLLGFTTQVPARSEVATSAGSIPRQLIGRETKVHNRRPSSWNGLRVEDATVLDFLRRRGCTSELSGKETVRRLLTLLSEGSRFERLLKVASTEPPRVRAMLGAIGQELKKPKKKLEPLRRELNPLSRFEFGLLSALKYADQWQAKERGHREAI